MALIELKAFWKKGAKLNASLDSFNARWGLRGGGGGGGGKEKEVGYKGKPGGRGTTNSDL